ncbi:MAG TPA: hypothetical protein VGG28_17255 [Kofleriaceae bacterium]
MATIWASAAEVSVTMLLARSSIVGCTPVIDAVDPPKSYSLPTYAIGALGAAAASAAGATQPGASAMPPSDGTLPPPPSGWASPPAGLCECPPHPMRNKMTKALRTLPDEESKRCAAV